MIQKLSNQELENNLKKLVNQERKLLHRILEHISEVDSRKLYLEKAYSSLYEYLVKECGYSGSAAMRRISAARLMREVPTVAEKIQTGDLNLSQVSELSRAIKEKEKTGVTVNTLQKTRLVAVISGKTTGESQKEISQGLDLELKAPEQTFVQKDDSVNLQITLSREQYQMLQQCRDLAGNTLLTEQKDTSLAAVIELLSKKFLESKKAISKGSLHNKNIYQDNSSQNDDKSIRALKTLTPKTRKTILNRDYCCQYKDPVSGRICGNTFNLEIDHKQPRWADGNHALENLQVLCRAHNNYKYKREMNLGLLLNSPQ